MGKETCDRLIRAAVLIDEGLDEHEDNKLKNGIRILDQINPDTLNEGNRGELHYYYGNAWWNLWLLHLRADARLSWSWTAEEAQRAVFYYRSSLANLSDSPKDYCRRYQAFINLGNALNTFGRFVEAQRY
ncbi:hypothetical protein TRIP_C50002 [Candidatus Zixiibacteriota bacterium]|nr:hypothetical protein TRIP_C50002 [candidate division Zixibacteria bacterium]